MAEEGGFPAVLTHIGPHDILLRGAHIDEAGESPCGDLGLGEPEIVERQGNLPRPAVGQE